MMDNGYDISIRFDIKPEHTLREQSRDENVQAGKHCEVRWFVELDGQRQVVARYRSWITTMQSPPYRKQNGWEKYSAGGTLVDREVFYSKRADMEYLH